MVTGYDTLLEATKSRGLLEKENVLRVSGVRSFMSVNNIIFDNVHKNKMPDTVRVINYAREKMSIDTDRWGTIFQVKDMFRVLIKLEVI